MKRCWRIFTLGLCTAAAVGCAQPNKMDPSAMKPPSRPAELDRLEPWVGTWTISGDGTMGGKKMTSTGTATIAWECDRRVLVERMEVTCEEMKEMGKMTGMIVYAWSPHEKEYETNYFNSMGMSADGEMKYNEATRTWHMTGEGDDPMTGAKTHWVGEMKMPDNNTMEWTHATWDAWKLKKLDEGKGTARRQ